MPEQHSKWQSVYHDYRRWTREGLFDRILQQLHVNSMMNDASTGVFSMWIARTFEQTDQHLVLKKGKTKPADHALGRSRGSFGTKLHLIADGQGINYIETNAAI